MMKKTYVAALLLGLLCLTMIGSVSAQTRFPGVFPGNTFTYDVFASWSSTDPNVAVPSDLLDINKTEFYRVSITEVVGAEVTAQSMWRFTNGTEETNITGVVNLETGVYSGPSTGFWAIVAGNLNVGDQLHPSGRDFITVNATSTRNYTSGPRETNQLMLTYSGSDTIGDYIEYVNYYFDKQTGMLVQLSDQKTYSNPSQTISKYWRIKDSNVGLIPVATQGPQPTSTQGPRSTSDFPTIYVVIAAVAIIIPIVIAVVVLRKRRRESAELEDDLRSLQ